jgi:hypothetical protein
MLLALFTCALPLPSFAQSSGLTGAMPPFAADGKQYGELGRDLQSLLTAHLSAQDNVIMVERAELDAALSEAEPGISGTVDPQSAAKIGYITGAQVLITGRSFGVQKELVTVAKIIGTETTRVFGETATMPLRRSAVEISVERADKISVTTAQRGASLVAPVVPKQDTVAKLKPLVNGERFSNIYTGNCGH